MRPVFYRGSYYAVWYEAGKGTLRVSLRTKDREAAERAILDLKRDRITPIGATVGEIVQAYLDEKEGRIADHARLVNGWKAAKTTFGHLRPDQITRELCRAYAETRRAAGRKDGTIIKEINVVRQAVNWRKVQGAIFEVPNQPPPKDRHLTRDEFRMLLDACRMEPHIYLFCVLALCTAGRATAILQLTWDRVDFQRGIIRLGVVGEQNRKGRAVVPMNTRAREALTAAREAARTAYVIEYADRPIGSVKKGFAAAAKRAGLDGVTPHVMRHTAAVWMAEAGTPMDEIASYLGHSDPRITYRVYAKFSPTYLQKAAAALDV